MMEERIVAESCGAFGKPRATIVKFAPLELRYPEMIPEPDETDMPTTPRTARLLVAPRFSVRALLAVTAVIAAWLAVMRSFGSLGACLFLLGSSIVVLHMAGNVIGIRLRESAPRRRPVAPARAVVPDDSDATSVLSEAVPPAALSRRASLGIPLILATSAGMLCSGLLGYEALARIYANNLTLEAGIVGAASMAALGGFGGFGLWGLIHVAATAWWQAHRDSAADQRRACDDRGRNR
jgi:hypothetical protein